MLIKKTYKFKIYPNKKQAELMSKHFGTTRFIWNYFLNKRKESYLKEKKSLSFYSNCQTLTVLKKADGLNWLQEINAQSLQASLKDLDTAYGRFFKKQAMFPKFKKKGLCTDSFRCPQNIKIVDGKLQIPKFKPIKINIHREIEGKILFVTISKTKTDKYFAAITCEVEHTPLPKPDKAIGIDLGIKNLAVCSDGTVFENIKTTKKYAKKLAYTQRQLSKKKKGSNNRSKQRKQVALVHEKIRNVRIDNIHKFTMQTVRNNGIIVTEDLNVSGMIKNHNLAKAIADASWYETIRQLGYKSNWDNRDFVKVDRFFPSSKLCSECGYINQNLTLKDRTWICQKCLTAHDRDFNASQNILRQGLKLISGCGAQSENKQKRDEASGCKQSL
jgi:putative transposase